MRTLLHDFISWIFERILDLATGLLDLALFEKLRSRRRPPERVKRRSRSEVRPASETKPPAMPPLHVGEHEAGWTLPQDTRRDSNR
tara:strand:+ start:1232 stop:1489 length:258 start_codon:yes stop_codon:yes gene_type:complete